jgi:PAB1-binding protein PBP1
MRPFSIFQRSSLPSPMSAGIHPEMAVLPLGGSVGSYPLTCPRAASIAHSSNLLATSGVLPST